MDLDINSNAMMYIDIFGRYKIIYSYSLFIQTICIWNCSLVPISSTIPSASEKSYKAYNKFNLRNDVHCTLVSTLSPTPTSNLLLWCPGHTSKSCVRRDFSRIVRDRGIKRLRLPSCVFSFLSPPTHMTDEHVFAVSLLYFPHINIKKCKCNMNNSNLLSL